MTVAAAFDSGASTFAALSVDGRLKVWDVSTRELVCEYAPADHLQDLSTCFVFRRHGDQVNTTPQGSSKKRKRRSSVSSKGPTTAVALGKRSGVAIIFSIQNAAVAHVLKGHTGAVSAIEWSSTGTIFTASEDRTIIVWNAAKGERLQRWKTQKDTVTALGASPDGKTVLAAARSIKLWSVKKETVLREFTGHQNNTRAVLWLLKGDKFLSYAEDETMLSVWDLKEDGSLAAANFKCPAGAGQVMGLERAVGGKSRFRVAVLDATGRALVYDESTKQSRRPSPFGSKIELQGNDEVPAKILGCAIAETAGELTSQMVIAYGSDTSPMFESVKYHQADDESNLIKHQILKRNLDAGRIATEVKGATKRQQQKQTQAAKGDTTNANLMARADAKESLTTVAMGAEEEEALQRMKPMDQPTIEERMKELELTAEASGSSEVNGRGGPVAKEGTAPQSHSLLQLLVQALHSDDNQLLEECLGQTNEEVVRNTIKRLPTSYVVPFLSQVVERFEAKPSRGVELTVWIRFVLLLHTSYLMTVPDLMRHLAGLYQLIDTRLSAFKKLMKLSGRLDLVLSQITERGETGNDATFDDLQCAEAVYEEEDSGDDAVVQHDEDGLGKEDWA